MQKISFGPYHSAPDRHLYDNQLSICLHDGTGPEAQEFLIRVGALSKRLSLELG